MWQQWLNALLGVWLVAVPFLGLTSVGLTWSLVITGLAVALLALWAISKENSTEYHHQRELELRHQH